MLPDQQEESSDQLASLLCPVDWSGWGNESNLPGGLPLPWLLAAPGLLDYPLGSRCLSMQVSLMVRPGNPLLTE